MAGFPKGRGARGAALSAGRSLDELLQVIGADDGQPLSGHEIIAAYQNGLITGEEGKRLQWHSRKTPRAQARAAAGSRPFTDDEIAALRAKLDKLSTRLYAEHPELDPRRSKTTPPDAGPVRTRTGDP